MTDDANTTDAGPARGNGLYDLTALPFDGNDNPLDALAAPKDVLDDISKLVISSEDTVLEATREILTTISIRKPKKDEFFRTHPTACFGPCAIFEVKSGLDRESYLITPSVWTHLKDEVLKGHAKKVVLRVTIARSGLLFLNPITAPDPLAKANDYNDSAREAAIEATKAWLRMQANPDMGRYQVWIAEGNISEPKWPDFDIGDLVKKAFKGKVIADVDHELIATLRGAA